MLSSVAPVRSPRRRASPRLRARGQVGTGSPGLRRRLRRLLEGERAGVQGRSAPRLLRPAAREGSALLRTRLLALDLLAADTALEVGLALLPDGQERGGDE